MVYAVISDIHANAGALRTVLDDAWREGATQIVCLGDIVGYGPEPVAVLTTLRGEKPIIVAGNHDDAVAGRIDESDFMPLAAEAVRRHRAELREDDLAWLKALPYIANIDGDAVCVHGDLTAPREFRYIETPEDAAANFAVCDTPLIFVGHTHEPCLFLRGGSGKTYKTKPQDFTLEPGKRYIVNVGSVGYPRDCNGTCLSSYVIYDSERREVRFRTLPFSVASVMQRGDSSPLSPPEVVKDEPPQRRNPFEDFDWRDWLAGIFGIIAIISVLVLTIFFARITRRYEARPSNPLMHKAVKSVASAKVDVADHSKPVKKTIILKGREKHVRANVRLAGNSASARLTVNFLSQAGAVISQKTEEFARSKTGKMTVSPGTHRVEFIVTPKNKGESVFIKKFEPSAD